MWNRGVDMMSASMCRPLRVVVLDDYQDVARVSAEWSQLGAALELTVVTQHIEDEQELLGKLRGAEVIVAMRERTALRRVLLDQLPDLRLIVTTGPRNGLVDPPPNVMFCGTRSLTSPTVELTWALIASSRRNLEVEVSAMRAGSWQSTVGESLEGATLGIIGLGNIGTRVATVANAFGMHVLAWSANLSAETADERGAERVELEELLYRSDVVSIHTRLSERTRGLIGAHELAMMGSEAVLVNTSRAEIVDQEAMLSALQDGSLGGAALDVYDQEPLPAQHPLRRAPRTLLTPHLGYVTRQNYALFYGDAVENIAAYCVGTPLRVIAPESQ